MRESVIVKSIFGLFDGQVLVLACSLLFNIKSKTGSKHLELWLLELMAKVGPHKAGGPYDIRSLAFIARSAKAWIDYHSLSHFLTLSCNSSVLSLSSVKSDQDSVFHVASNTIRIDHLWSKLQIIRMG